MNPFDGIADPDYYARQAAKYLRRGFRAGAAAAEDGAIAESVPVAATFTAIFWLFEHFAKWVEKELKGKSKDPGSPDDDKDDPSHPIALEDYAGMAEPFRGPVPNTVRSAARIAHKSVPLAAHLALHKQLSRKVRDDVHDSARKRRGHRPDPTRPVKRRRIDWEGNIRRGQDYARRLYNTVADNRDNIATLMRYYREARAAGIPRIGM